ncbi:MAG: GNAT family N-acetyltransferase [Cyclobacteriaceae bacterium]
MDITNIDKSEYPAVVDIWEASVRATHHFLPETDIQFFRPLILNEYLNAVELRCARDEEGTIVGFLGVADGNIEMLFLHPDTFGKGVGKLLLNCALNEFKCTKVDVNEDNHNAVAFYKHMGFEVVSRAETDPLGKPYPILHMELGN